MNAPERVSVKLTEEYESNWWGVVTDEFDEDGVEYVRTDLVRALVEAASAQLQYMDMCGDRGDLERKLRAALAAFKGCAP